MSLHSDGDIVLSAPEGRVHFQSKYFSRQVGDATAEAIGPLADIPINPSGNAPAINGRKTASHKADHHHPNPCSGKGMATPANEKEFACDMKVLQEKWPTLSSHERTSGLETITNKQLTKSGVPHVDFASSSTLPTSTNGAMDFQKWTLDINSKLTDQPVLTDAQTQQLGSTAFHESRHAEQWYLAARNQAGNGKSAQNIHTVTFMPDDVTKEAAAHPLGQQDPLYPCSRSVNESVCGRGASSRNATLKALPALSEKVQAANDRVAKVLADPTSKAADKAKAYDDAKSAYADYKPVYDRYSALPEEADAWNAGNDVKNILAH